MTALVYVIFSPLNYLRCVNWTLDLPHDYLCLCFGRLLPYELPTCACDLDLDLPDEQPVLVTQ